MLYFLKSFPKKKKIKKKKKSEIDMLKDKVMFGNSFCFLFLKTCLWEYKEKTIFLYFWNQKHIWLVEI